MHADVGQSSPALQCWSVERMHYNAHEHTHIHIHTHRRINKGAWTHAHTTRCHRPARTPKHMHTQFPQHAVCAQAFLRRRTPLHVAAENGHAAAAAALLTHGADVNAKEGIYGCGGRSLFWATDGVCCATVADRDGIDAMQTWMHARTHTDAHTCTPHE